MLFKTQAALVAAAAVAVSASPVQSQVKSVAIPLRHVSRVTSIKNIVEKGAARLAHINGESDKLESRSRSGSITNEGQTYVAPVNIGGYTWDLIVDTGSSNTWCGAQQQCEQTDTGRSTGGQIAVPYGSGSFSGTEYIDEVSFGGLTVSRQSIGSAEQAQGFSGIDGIIGFGPVDLTTNTVDNANSVPTFMDNLYAQGSISSEVLGVYFHPESGSDSDDTNGELTLGGVDSSKFSGSISYFPKARSGAAAKYWGINIGGISYGSTTLASSATGIVDTGTTLIYIPSSAYSRFLSTAGRDGETDRTSGLASFSSAPTANLVIRFGSTAFTLTPSQYLVPRAQYENNGIEDSGRYYAWITDGGSSGVNTIIGQKFLENYYSVFDTTNSRIGFAPRN